MWADIAVNEIAYEKYMLEKERKVKMAQKVLVLGDSGTGKSASLRNFKPEELLVINAAGKPLPFKNHFETFTPRFEKMTQDILSAMDKTEKKVIVVDDAQYIMSFQYMRRIKENGWDKWNDIQGDFFNIIKACDYMPEDVIVYFLSHLQRDDEGHEKIKTMGKMLDEKITIEGLFTTVLKTSVKDGQYFFLTQNSGLDTVKSPIGMFPSYAIDNDLKYVDEKIRNYYEIGDFKADEEIAQMDQEVSHEDVQKPDSKGRTRRNRKGSDKGSNGSGIENNSQSESTSNGNAAEKTGEGNDVSARVEQPSEQPKTRRRKARTEQAEEVTAETEKASETAENVPQKAEIAEVDKGTGAIVGDASVEESAVAAEAPKRRRRRRNTDDQPVLDISSDDLPF